MCFSGATQSIDSNRKRLVIPKKNYFYLPWRNVHINQCGMYTCMVSHGREMMDKQDEHTSEHTSEIRILLKYADLSLYFFSRELPRFIFINLILWWRGNSYYTKYQIFSVGIFELTLSSDQLRVIKRTKSAFPLIR